MCICTSTAKVTRGLLRHHNRTLDILTTKGELEMTQLANNQQDQTTIPGGWTPFRELTTADEKVFKEATQQLLGVKYTPLSVSTQVVEGTNYRFLCDGKVVSPNAETQQYMVQIYQSPRGVPEVTSISLLHSPNTMTGGWSAWCPVDAESQSVFDKATNGLLGVQYTAREVSKQVVAGMNYMFRCIAKPVVPNPTEYKALVEIYQPLGEGTEPIITGIVRTNW
jgi:hypothetical protein